jgi:oxygen-independent coproporphyrinogen-3 oxidase
VARPGISEALKPGTGSRETGNRESKSRESKSRASGTGIYIHIPFCQHICNYCNFNRGLHEPGLRQRYVQALIKDIRTFADPDIYADSIYFGGGTPSLLEPAELGAIINACRDCFSVDPDAEISMEANPESSPASKLEQFRQAGANRLSFGVQSFHDEELQRLGRLHSVATAIEAVRGARAAGFDNLSLDLMMWLPGQSTADWLSNVDALIDLEPDHASLYLLEVYPNAPLRDEMARAGWSVAPDDDAAEMYLQGLERLDRAGLAQYEISNVARSAERRSRHNLKYWQDGEWLAFGCGAHASFRGERWRTISATADYVTRIEAGDDPRIDRRALAGEERFEDALFMGLRLVDGLDLELMRQRYGIDIWVRYGPDLEPYVSRGWLLHEPGRRLALTRNGMLLANDVMSVFIGGAVR